MLKLELKKPLEFEWDAGNKTKSFTKHGITNQEAEEIFGNFNIILSDDKHSSIENRFIILGKSDRGKIIFSSFTARNFKIRIISSRLASQKERNTYEKEFKENSQI